MTAVVGEDKAKLVSAVPVGIPREMVVGTVERQTELAGGMEWVARENTLCTLTRSHCHKWGSVEAGNEQ